MAIKEKYIEVTLTNRNILYYESLGYDIPRRKDKWGVMTVPRGTKISIKVLDLQEGSKTLLTKICDMSNCKKEIPNQPYKSILNYRKKGDGLDRCFDCGREKSAQSNLNNLIYENSLEYLSPKIANELHKTKNKITSDKISNFSQMYVWWVCLNEHCKHEWKTRVSSRTVEKTNCPVCAKKKRKGEGNPNWKNGVSSLNHYLRSLLDEWRLSALNKGDYKCAISGQTGKGDLDIHHTKPFNVIRDGILKELTLNIRKTIGEYSSDDIAYISKRFLEEHSKYEGILIRGDIHILFHHLYGWDENVCMNDLEEFKIRFNSGEFENLKDVNNQYVLPNSSLKEDSHVLDFMS